MISIKSKKHANIEILRNIKLNCQTQKIIALIAPSGAGKTTLLNIVAGLDHDFIGQIDLNKIQGNYERELAFMFQEPRLMPWLSVYDNIELVIPVEQRTEAIKQRILTMLEEVGLAGSEQQFPTQLSGGMKRRVALVRAFILAPALLLMDEPFQSLDVPTANQLRELLLRLWQSSGSMVLLVTHDLREALMLADHIVFLSTKPAHIILEYDVPLSRPRQLDSEAVQQCYQDLMIQYPDLLKGSIEEKSKHE